MMRALPLISVLLIAPAGVSAAEPTAVTGAPISAPSPQASLTGTLFFSSQERAKLDKARRTGSVLEPDKPAEAPLIINGVVKRGDGSTSVWVNGALVDPVSDTLAAK
ncbi:MAG: hypothetical protein JNJ55_13615, partial [Betaproteobacteria bacterium]|nr:hypothetical protein [Betaproteobacteria bacterium]